MTIGKTKASIMRKEMKMATSDLIAIGILIFCIVLSVLGTLKWLLRFIAGVILGLMILACIGLLSDNPKFDKVSRGVFRGGVVIPCMKSQIQSVGEFISRSNEASYDDVAMSK